VELLGDVHFRVSPLTTRDIEELIGETRLVTRLRGYRGRPAGDLDALRDLLGRVSKLADDLPEIAELDLNPVLVLAHGRGCQIVDVRIRVRDPQWRPPSRRPGEPTTQIAPAPRA
jgi:acyl-CoA synthetase (NDP forming)